MDIDFLSLLDPIADSDFLDNVTTLTSPPFSIDFESLLDEVADEVEAAVSDVDEVVDSVTELVIDTLDTLDIDSDFVDTSGVVEQVVNFIGNLPDDVTTADALSELADIFSMTLSSLSDTELAQLLTDVNQLIANSAANLSQFSITSVVEDGTELVEDLLESVGMITVDGDSLSGELTLGGVTRSFTTDLSDEIDDFIEDASELLSGITGNASLSDGQFIGDVTLGDTAYQLSLDVTAALTDSFTSLFSTAEATLPFTNGVLEVDIDTFLGEVEGLIDFAGGDLDLDLATPFGDVDTSLVFPEDAQVDVPINLFGVSEAELDFAAGVFRTSFLNVPVEVSLEMFSGELALSEGEALLTLDDAFGSGMSIETPLDVGPLASQVAIVLTEDLSGELTIDSGEIDGTIDSVFGTFNLATSFDDLLLQASSFIDQTRGVITLNDGLAAINFSTPLGDWTGAVALSAVQDGLADVLDLLA